jgi:glycosyltransferase involved in cell wall biosynthesis
MTDPRSVALATTALTRGGVWRHIEDLGMALQERGVEVVIALPASSEQLQRAAEKAGLRWTTLRDAVVRRQIDVWHAHLHDTYDKQSLAAIAVRRRFGASVITEHLPRTDASDPRLERQHRRTRGASAAKTAFKRAQFAIADEVIAVGTSSARFLEERYGLPAETVLTIHNGVPAGPRPSAPNPGERLRFVTVGSFARQKGQDVLIDAARRSRGGWQVTMYGDGPHLEGLRAAAADIPRERLTFAGWDEDPLGKMAAADVLCMPSRWESFPYAALEAGSLGRGVVGTWVDGLDEIVVPGVTGLLVKPGCAIALAEAMDGLAATPASVATWGQAAYQRVTRDYRLERMVDSVLDVYARVCRRRR